MVGVYQYQTFVTQLVCNMWGGRELSRPYHGNKDTKKWRKHHVVPPPVVIIFFGFVCMDC